MANGKIACLGFSLLEMLLALALSLVLFSALTGIYVTVKKNVFMQAYLQETQENEREVSLWLRSGIETAGYAYCMILPHRIQGTDKDVTIYKSSLHAVSLYMPMRTHSILFAMNNLSFNVGDELLISDCFSYEVIRIQSLAKLQQGLLKITSMKPLNRLYGLEAYLGTYEIYRYYVSKTTRKTKKNHAIYALYRVGSDHRPLELVEGVSAMRLHYLERRSNRLVVVDANQVLDWDAVLGMTIDLLFMDVQDRFPSRRSYLHIALKGLH